MYYASRMRSFIAVMIVLAVFVAPLTAQSDAGADSVVGMAENLGTTAGRLLGGAPALLGGQRSWTISVGDVSWDGQTPRSADLITAIIEDGLLDTADRLAGSVDFQLQRGGPTELVIEASGSGGERDGIFVVQLIEDQGSQGRVVASGRVRIVLSAEVRQALAPSGMAGSAEAAPDVADNPADARQLSAGDVVSDQELEPAGDEDWYVIDARGSAGDDQQPALSIYTQGPTDTYLEFYGPDDPDSLIAQNDDSDGTNAALQVMVEPGGRYWVKVRGFAGSATGPYQLYVEETTMQLDGFEPNNVRSSATTIGSGMLPLQAGIRPANDSDWYLLSEALLAGLGGGGADTVLVLGTRSSIDTVIEVVDANGTELVYSDDDGEGANARAVLPAGRGPFYAEVRGFGSWNEGDYELYLERVEVVTDEWEPDNSREGASAVGLNDPERSYTFSTGSDADWVRFEIPAGAEGSRIVAETGGDVDTYMRLYDADGTQLETDDDSGEGFNARLSEFLPAGVYFIETTPLYLSGDEGAYTFRLREQ